MTTQRLERILFKLAEQHAPHLVKPGWEQTPNALRRLARSLADYNLLIIMGSVPAHLAGEKEKHIQNWVNAYARFHNLLAQTLFPSYAALEARFADEYAPTVIVIEAQIAPIFEAMAGYLVPFVASRKSHTRVPEAELQELTEVILSRLAANDLSRPIYITLLQDSMTNVRKLLELPIQQIALTDFDRRLFDEVPKPLTLPTSTNTREMMAVSAGPPAVAPAAEPEEFKLEQFDEIEAAPLTPTERMFIRPLNLTFERKPPVPDLPARKPQK